VKTFFTPPDLNLNLSFSECENLLSPLPNPSPEGDGLDLAGLMLIALHCIGELFL